MHFLHSDSRYLTLNLVHCGTLSPNLNTWIHNARSLLNMVWTMREQTGINQWEYQYMRNSSIPQNLENQIKHSLPWSCIVMVYWTRMFWRCSTGRPKAEVLRSRSKRRTAHSQDEPIKFGCFSSHSHTPWWLITLNLKRIPVSDT